MARTEKHSSPTAGFFDPIVFYTTDPYVSWSGVVLNNVYVQTEPGTYYFEYVSWDDSYWYGTYTIYINEGEAGGLFYDGLDGSDIYFELVCYSFGPSFYDWSSPNYAATSKADSGTSADDQLFEELSRGAVESAPVAERSVPAIPLVGRTSLAEGGHQFRQVVEAGQ